MDEQKKDLIENKITDYTKWQRDFYDAIPEDELRNRVRKYNAENPFQGDKAVRV